MKSYYTNPAYRYMATYGPLMSGDALVRALGYNTKRAFNAAARSNQTPVSVFNILGRRGKYALTHQVASWLANLESQHANDHFNPRRESRTKAKNVVSMDGTVLDMDLLRNTHQEYLADRRMRKRQSRFQESAIELRQMLDSMTPPPIKQEVHKNG